MSDVLQHEEAAQALEIAKKFLESGNLEKAIKMLEKSLRMRKTAEGEALLSMAKKRNERHTAKRSNPEPVTPANSTTTNNHGTNNSTEAPKNERPYTTEQVENCHIVLQAKTHYETLKIERTASADEIKKSYRKLALKFHPDKNAAPKADEAFKKISKAFKVLVDPDERAHYDRYGETDQGSNNHHHHHHRNGQHGFQEMDPDDLMRWFFSGGNDGFGGAFGGFGPNVRVHHFGGGGGGGGNRRQEQQQYNNQVQLPFQQVIFMFVFMMLLFSSFIPSFDSTPARPSSRFSTKPFSLYPDRTFTIPRRTSMHGVVSDLNYYVDPKFATTIGKSARHLYEVETEVMIDHHTNFKQKCQSELAYKNDLINRAKATRDQTAFDAASKLSTPSCVSQAELESKRKKFL